MNKSVLKGAEIRLQTNFQIRTNQNQNQKTRLTLYKKK